MKCICETGEKRVDEDSMTTVMFFRNPDTDDWWLCLSNDAVIVQFCPFCGKELK